MLTLARKLHALARVSPFMDSKKLVAIMNAFMTSQFSYFPPIWTFHSRKTDHKINRIHERALRLAYKDNVSTFEQLLATNNSVTTYERNLQLLMTNIFKTKSKLNPDFMTDIFKERSVSYNLLKGSDTLLPVVRTTTYDIETVSYFRNKLWPILPSSLQSIPNLENFKKRIRSCRIKFCGCRISKSSIDDLDFV